MDRDPPNFFAPARPKEMQPVEAAIWDAVAFGASAAALKLDPLCDAEDRSPAALEALAIEAAAQAMAPFVWSVVQNPVVANLLCAALTQEALASARLMLADVYNRAPGTSAAGAAMLQ